MSKKVQTRIRIKYKFDPFVEDQREYEFRIKNVQKAGSYKKYNIATDPLTWLNARKYITEEQCQAGEYFSKLCHNAQVGRLKSCLDINIYKTPGFHDKMTSQLDAVDKLNRIHKRLGDKTTHLMWLVCYAGYSIKDIKIMYHYKKTYVGEKIRESLQELADLLSKKF